MSSESIISIFKIGIGPSSSHTVGPWIAASRFIHEAVNTVIEFDKGSIIVDLYGSLAHTGLGHGSDFAIFMGLSGYPVDEISQSDLSSALLSYRTNQRIVHDKMQLSFNAVQNVHLWKGQFLPYHPNGMTFKLIDHSGHLFKSKSYYSIGGGFVLSDDETEQHDAPNEHNILSSADAIKKKHIETGKTLIEILTDYELQFRPFESTKEQLFQIYDVMLSCAYEGCHTSGILPGGLSVERRAQLKHDKLMPSRDYETPRLWLDAIKQNQYSFRQTIDWVSCLAIGVNEQNAAFGKVVTAPTNGAAGVIPAVLIYIRGLLDMDTSEDDVINFLLVAGMIGQLYKNGATISAAAGGCQAEIGVSSSMAAAGLASTLGGSIGQVFMAAEIAMEHHLGLTCDPVDGLVQIPCIERNSIGAMKAITAAQLALNSDPLKAKVSLDQVIKSMWETAQDMNQKYKETSLGGLAINVMLPEC